MSAVSKHPPAKRRSLSDDEREVKSHFAGERPAASPFLPRLRPADSAHSHILQGVQSLTPSRMVTYLRQQRSVGRR